MIKITNEDNMELMSRYEDNYFDLAIVDPPYGININMNMGLKKNKRIKHERKKWDNEIPSDLYFKQLLRISKQQIVWGGNYFPYLWKDPCKHFIFWDKQVPEEISFSDGEMAWTSFDKAIKKFTFRNISTNGVSKIHPTQKPVKLYEWLLMNYAKEGDKIIDTHLGSGSIAIACHNLGFDLTACELDKDYYEAAIKRLKEHQAQLTIF